MFSLLKPIANLWSSQPSQSQQELEVEQRFGMELTTGPDSYGGSSAWTQNHLDHVQDTLSQLPSSHLSAVEELQLGGAQGNWGLHHGHTIHLAPEGLVPGERHPEATQMDLTLAHEVGHDVDERFTEASAKIMTAAGWVDGDLEDLPLGISARMGAAVEDEGKTYKPDRYDADRYVGYDTGAVPTGESWEYARSHPWEYFAEMYTKAANVPESLHNDMIGVPSAAADDAELQKQLALRSLATALQNGNPLDAVQSGWNALGAMGRHVESKDNAARMKDQWTTMREDVFGMDDTWVDLRAQDVQTICSETADVDSFREEGRKLMTHAQLDDLFMTYTEGC